MKTSHISSRLETLDQSIKASVEQSSNLEQQLADLAKAMAEAQDEIKVKLLLRSLEFPQMDHRVRAIHDADSDTFRWIFSNPDLIREREPDLEITFTDWLVSGSGIFHVAGKAGSGKSTLMKFLCVDNDKTTDLLQAWAESQEKELIFCQFFFWRITSIVQQKTLSGLIRALLHGVLFQVPELAPRLFPKRWNQQRPKTRQSTLEDRSRLELGSREISVAFENLMKDVDVFERYRLCFFIDGLDEFEQDPSIQMDTYYSLAKKLESWVSNSAGNVKMCVSSRELSEFTSRFPASQRITLHRLTMEDVFGVVTSRLENNEYFMQLREESAQNERRCVALIREIVGEAKGVFLWVVLVLNELERLLPLGGSLDVLERCVGSSHKDINRLVASIVESIPEAFRLGACYLMAAVMRVSAGMRVNEVSPELRRREKEADKVLGKDFQCRQEFIQMINLDMCRLIFDVADRGNLLNFDDKLALISWDLENDKQASKAERQRLSIRCRGILEIEESATRPVPVFTHRSMPEALQAVFSSDSLTLSVQDDKVMELIAWILLASCRVPSPHQLQGGFRRVEVFLSRLKGCDLSGAHRIFRLLKIVDEAVQEHWSTKSGVRSGNLGIVLYGCFDFGLHEYISWYMDTNLRSPRDKNEMLRLIVADQDIYGGIIEDRRFCQDLALRKMMEAGFSADSKYRNDILLSWLKFLAEDFGARDTILGEGDGHRMRDFLDYAHHNWYGVAVFLSLGADPDVWLQDEWSGRDPPIWNRTSITCACGDGDARVEFSLSHWSVPRMTSGMSLRDCITSRGLKSKNRSLLLELMDEAIAQKRRGLDTGSRSLLERMPIADNTSIEDNFPEGFRD